MSKKILNAVNRFLDTTTMYRVVSYYLLALWIVAMGCSFFGVLPFGPLDLLVSTALFFGTCMLSNAVLALCFRLPSANAESTYITAFILALILTPAPVAAVGFEIPVIALTSVCAMASKFILAWKNKHIFNPAAIGAVSAILVNQSASWWVGTRVMVPFVFFGGIFVIQKIRRWDLAISFFATAFLAIVGTHVLSGSDPFVIARKILLETPILFFTVVMITEPLSTPPTRVFRIAYGMFVGILFHPSVAIGSVSSTPELALLVGNVASFLASSKGRTRLSLAEKIRLSDGIEEFVFTPERPISFRPGQYAEWTIDTVRPDARGNRRYFTFASGPKEKEVRLGVKFYPTPSAFKQTLHDFPIGATVTVSQVDGDFVLPTNKERKLTFIAGGIGITPFVSMMRDCAYRNERRDAVLFYCNSSNDGIAYRDVCETAKRVGFRSVYAASDCNRVDEDMLKRELPDWKERLFYISGSHGMVSSFQSLLHAIGVPRRHIKTDYFPGLV